MRVNGCLDGLLDDALEGLLSMAPNRIDSAERDLRAFLADYGAGAGQDNSAVLVKLRQAHGAALQAAKLWRGCIPQGGYTAAGPVEQGPVPGTLSVTG